MIWSNTFSLDPSLATPVTTLCQLLFSVLDTFKKALSVVWNFACIIFFTWWNAFSFPSSWWISFHYSSLRSNDTLVPYLPTFHFPFPAHLDLTTCSLLIFHIYCMKRALWKCLYIYRQLWQALNSSLLQLFTLFFLVTECTTNISLLFYYYISLLYYFP